MYARVHDAPSRAHIDLRLSEVKAERVDNDQGHLALSAESSEKNGPPRRAPWDDLRASRPVY